MITKKNTLEILITSSHRVCDTIGGVEKFIESFSTWCNRRGVKVAVISRSLSVNPVKIIYGPFLAVKSEKGKIVKKVKLPFQLYYLGLMFFSFSSSIVLMRLVKKSRIESQNFLVFHAQDTNFAALATVVVGKIMKVPIVIHQHGPYEKLLPSKGMRLIERSINKITCGLSNIIIATDLYTKQYLKTVVPSEEKIKIIPAAINANQFEIRLDSYVTDHCFKIGYIGRLSPEKNLETLICAFNLFKRTFSNPCKLVIVGDGEKKDSLKQLVRTNQIFDDVVFAGFQIDINPFLSDLDIFVLPSVIEGTPISLMEAMSAGKAIIASNIPCIQKVVEHGKSALLFNPNDPKELSRLLLLLCNDPDLRSELGKNARTSAKQYDCDVIYPRILQLYGHLVNAEKS